MEGETNREYFKKKIDLIEPRGSTDTAGALEEAYKTDPDTVILFTDGEPTGPKEGTFQKDEAEKVYRLCEKHSTIPVNVVGLGCYFEKNLSEFLLGVAERTNGTFLGR